MSTFSFKPFSDYWRRTGVESRGDGDHKEQKVATDVVRSVRSGTAASARATVIRMDGTDFIDRGGRTCFMDREGKTWVRDGHSIYESGSCWDNPGHMDHLS